MNTKVGFYSNQCNKIMNGTQFLFFNPELFYKIISFTTFVTFKSIFFFDKKLGIYT